MNGFMATDLAFYGEKKRGQLTAQLKRCKMPGKHVTLTIRRQISVPTYIPEGTVFFDPSFWLIVYKTFIILAKKKKGVTDPRDFDSGLNIPFRHASNPFSNGFSN